jgi:hypothetical protein
LPPSLDLLGLWWIIGVALAMFGLEFFADMVPAFDLIWTRVPTSNLLFSTLPLNDCPRLST